MAPSPLQQRRTHNTLLFQKLLNLRDGASPFTLVLDTLEQSGSPVVKEFARRAKISKSQIIFISFATIQKKVPFEISSFITASNKPLTTLRNEILSHIPPPTTSTPSPIPPKCLLIIDTLHPLASNPSHTPHLSTFLSSLLTSPSVSLLATYHTDIPIHPPSSYQPHPITTLIYLATAILTITSLNHTLSQKRARDKSLVEPVFGLEELREGVIFGLKGKGAERGENGAVVLKMELRRRSGRGVVEDFVLLPPSASTSKSTITQAQLSTFILLDEHPLYTTPSLIDPLSSSADSNPAEADALETTFNLSLTDKQKRDREGVVLPYFDAQKDGGGSGPGEGGRILYEMGSMDREDFDDEEDEI